MAADRALAEDHQAAGEDIRTLDRDRDRHRLIGTEQVVARTLLNPTTAVDVHGVVDDLTHPLGHVVLGHGRDHRRGALIHTAGGEDTCGFHLVVQAANTGGGFLHTFELADRHLELATDATEGAGHAIGRLRGSRGQRRQRNAATGRQALDQHAPATAGLLLAADDGIQRHEHVLAEDRAVHERTRCMAGTDFHARLVGRDQGTGNAVFGLVLVAEQAFRVIQLERQTDNRRHRGQGDPALGEGELHAQHFLAVVLALAHDAGIGECARVGADFRTGQAEAGDFAAVGQAGQPLLLLFLGAVVHEQFARAERVRHHHGHGRGQRARGDLGHDRGLGDCRETKAAVLLRDEHREELVVANILPAFFGNVLELGHDFPLVQHVAQRFGFVIQKRLFFRGQLGALEVQQVLPVGLAAKHLGFPPGAAGFQRFALGVRHRRQHRLEALEDRLGYQLLAQALGIEDGQNWHEDHRRGDNPGPANGADRGQGHEINNDRSTPDRQ